MINQSVSLNILFCKWYSICEPGADYGFQTLGHNVDELVRTFDNEDYDQGYIDALSSELFKKRYDFVFSINFFPIISRVCNIFKIPYLCWTVDSPCTSLYSNTIENPINRIFMFDKSQYKNFFPLNPDCIFYLPLGCDYDTWNSFSLTDEDHKKYDCEISFIGSTYHEKCSYNKIEKDLSPYLRGYAEGLIRAQMNVYGYYFIEDALTDEFCESFKKSAGWTSSSLPPDYREDFKGIIADTYIGEKCTEQERLLTLKNISEHFSIDFYTQSDVSKLPNVNFCGAANSSTMMPKIFKCSKINLNMTSRPIRTGLPLRIYDIMCAGGFLLTNYQAEIPEQFTIGEDLVTYDSQEDLLFKIDYYLSHEEERKIIAQNGQRKVRENCTYEIRLREMLKACGFGEH